MGEHAKQEKKMVLHLSACFTKVVMVKEFVPTFVMPMGVGQDTIELTFKAFHQVDNDTMDYICTGWRKLFA